MKNRVLAGAATGAFLVFLGLGLYFGWNEFVLPNYAQASTFPLEFLLVFGFFAGLASFFSPCALPLFPAYVSYYLTVESNTENKSLKKPVLYGLLAGIGAITFFVLLGLLFAFFKESVAQYVSIIQPIVGFLLIALGVIMVFDLSINLPLFNSVSKLFRPDKNSSPENNFFVYGFGYAGVSLGCTLPLFISLFLVPFLGGNFLTSLLVFVAYSIALAAMMVLVTVLTAYSKKQFVEKIVQSTAAIRKISGIILILVGIYLVYYYFFLTMLPRLI